ncbi:sulfite exporter TauE/SafE family protein [Mesobacillus harenae]|uniref:urease accessory protein UreH domain-containing protein n=1 Tax=Mesobacillus harenae TaxID=2213203 RepID=UPI0015811368|nr:sulfite exporter TauE/SafE family protein [Mesobacillus harenae]
MEEAGLFSILIFGFFLGIKHAIEPDHIIAVSTVAGESNKLWKSSLIGVFWGIGHTLTLFLVGISIMLLKGDIPEIWAMSLEFLVGIMLVFFGLSAIKKVRSTSSGSAKLNSLPYNKSIFMGFIHGLAGSAAMILLTMTTVSNVWEGVLYILVFGLGTVVGMLAFTTILGIPFMVSSKNRSVNKVLLQGTGLISSAFGIYYMYNLGVTEGLFTLWIK